jgi:hypothetical protein
MPAMISPTTMGTRNFFNREASSGTKAAKPVMSNKEKNENSVCILRFTIYDYDYDLRIDWQPKTIRYSSFDVVSIQAKWRHCFDKW